MPEHAAALDFCPDIVICNLGINDIMDWPKFGKADFRGDYKKLLNCYRELPTMPEVFVWNKLAPLFPGQTYHGSNIPGEINAAITAAAKDLGVNMMDMHMSLKNDAALFPDHIHPNVAGAKKIAEETAKQIKKAVR